MARLVEVSAKSPLAGAIRYTLGHWDGLTVFLDDGRVEVDSNTVERTIRPIARNRCEGPTSRREGEESEAMRLKSRWARDG